MMAAVGIFVVVNRVVIMLERLKVLNEYERAVSSGSAG